MGQASIQGWYEGFLKDCPSGELTKEQFVEMYSKIFPSGNADNFSQNIFRTFDTNNSGTIDFRGFMLALHVTSKGSPEEKLSLAFRMYDVDGNGTIERAQRNSSPKWIKTQMGRCLKTNLWRCASKTKTSSTSSPRAAKQLLTRAAKC